MSYVETINRIPVTFQDLWQLTNQANDIHAAGGRDLESLMFLIARIYKGEPQKAGAVLMRMQALVRLLADEGVSGWTLPKQPDGAIPVQEAVFAAAAVQPLVEIDNDARFDRSEFMDKVLELAESEGNA